MYLVDDVCSVKLLFNSNNLQGRTEIDVQAVNVNDCVSEFPPGVCPSVPCDISLDPPMHCQTNRQTFKNNVCPNLFRIVLLKMRADPSGSWTSDDDEIFDGAIHAESLHGAEMFHCRMG